MQVYSVTDIGKIRKSNQDAYFAKTFSDGNALAVVCDGMGGANAGEIASNTAVKIISEYFSNSYNPSMSNNSIAELLRNAILSANIDIYDMAEKDISLSGMGTTVVAAFVKNDSVVICHVGDSRAYLINKEIRQLTRDHSVVQSLIESGKLSLKEAKAHPKKNVITRALGVEENVIPDCDVLSIGDNDFIMLCTDGLSNFVDSNNILKIFKKNDASNVTECLINSALAAGGEDNITVVLVSH